jgi:carbon-monoxide dehydrogenase small subunit
MTTTPFSDRRTKRTEIGFSLNGAPVRVMARGDQRLIDLLRGPELDLTGTKEGCGEGECGACTVLVDGRAVNACLWPAFEVEDREVLTIEGLLGPRNELSTLQRAFVEHGGIQCGFCTPGMILAAKALLDQNPTPSDEEIRLSIVGNLCRCTGYQQIVASIQAAASALASASEEQTPHE